MKKKRFFRRQTHRLILEVEETTKAPPKSFNYNQIEKMCRKR